MGPMINIKCEWKGRMKFEAQSGQHSWLMDASGPVGEGSAPTPKQLLVAAVCGCTAMDVVALMKKHKQELESFVVDSEGELTTGHPSVFKELKLLFRARGHVEADTLLEAIKLSQTKYCGVTAMISSTVPVRYEVELNGEKIGHGEAKFN